MSTRYAAGTRTGIVYSQNEVMRALQKAGATHTILGNGPDADLIGFTLDGRQYRLSVKKPTREEVGKMYEKTGDWPARIDAEFRRRWRAAVLWVKATLEYAEGDPEILQRAFLGSMALPDGRTFSQWARPQIDVIYDSGTMPPLLGTGTDS